MEQIKTIAVFAYLLCCQALTSGVQSSLLSADLLSGQLKIPPSNTSTLNPRQRKQVFGFLRSVGRLVGRTVCIRVARVRDLCQRFWSGPDARLGGQPFSAPSIGAVRCQLSVEFPIKICSSESYHYITNCQPKTSSSMGLVAKMPDDRRNGPRGKERFHLPHRR